MGRTGKGLITVKCDRCGCEMQRYESLIHKRVFCSNCRREDPATRFWRKVDTSQGEDACWPWTACRNRDGYGCFPWEEKGEQRSHRIAWIFTNGEIPEGKCVLHDPIKCNHRWCCNPKHMYLGTQVENVRDMIMIGTKAKVSGTQHPNSVLTDDAVKEIRERYNTVEAIELATKFGVSVYCIRDVAKRRSWTHIA